MKNLITTRKQEIRAESDSGEHNERRDIFSRMIKASEAEGKLALTDEELVRLLFFTVYREPQLNDHHVGWEYLLHALCWPWCV
jgi:hypothetical protein